MSMFSDVNECLLPKFCHQTLATCRNTDGSFECMCNNGYAGTGAVCGGM